MAENPFGPNYRMGGLLGMIGTEPKRTSLLDLTTPKSPVSPMARAIASLLIDRPTPALPVEPYPYTSGLGGMSGYRPPPTPRSPSLLPPVAPGALSFGSLARLVESPPPALYAPPPAPKPVAPEVKRKAFFSFHFDDAFRTNNVRNSWKIAHPDSATNRSFYDSSLWESRKLTNDEAIKRLIRGGVLYTSAVCVLAGIGTWDRQWVRYEIARAIIDGRGLLTVHLNNINHHLTKGPHPRGHNPLAFMGIAKLQRNTGLPPQYFLYEKRLVVNAHGRLDEEWHQYGDHKEAVKKPGWVTDPSLNHVVALGPDAAEYDYVLDYGHRNIGSWIDKAAKQAGR